MFASDNKLLLIVAINGNRQQLANNGEIVLYDNMFILVHNFYEIIDNVYPIKIKFLPNNYLCLNEKYNLPLIKLVKINNFVFSET